MHQRRWLNELQILRFSVVLECLFGICGILVAWCTGSQAVLLDGSYSLLCTLTMMANVRVSKLVRQPPSAKNPYGLPTMEPLMLILEGFILLGLCTALMMCSIRMLCSGGYLPAFNLALVYETFSTIIGGLTTVVLYMLHRSSPSPLIHFEFQEWLLDTAVSGVAAVAFAIACVIGNDHLVTPYIDSLLTISLLLVLIRLPLQTLRKNFRQLLLQDVASPKLVAQTRDAIRAQCDTRQRIDISMIWLGRWLWVNIELTVVDNDAPSYREMQAIRAAVAGVVSQVCDHYRIQLIPGFSRD